MNESVEKFVGANNKALEWSEGGLFFWTNNNKGGIENGSQKQIEGLARPHTQNVRHNGNDQSIYNKGDKLTIMLIRQYHFRVEYN